jgi:hypothetical protein
LPENANIPKDMQKNIKEDELQNVEVYDNKVISKIN